jgi:hypothetical protein
MAAAEPENYGEQVSASAEEKTPRALESGDVLPRQAPETPLPLGWGWDALPVVLDWFGQGLPDLLVSAGGGSDGRIARIYRRQPATSANGDGRYDAGAEVKHLAGLRFFCPIPSGNERRFDLVALDSTGLVFLTNLGTATAPEFPTRDPLGIDPSLGLGPGRIAQIVAEDWDGDGLVDLLVGFDDMREYWPEGDRVPVAQQVGFNERGGHPGYDRDGRWRGRPAHGRPVWLRNVGKPGAPRFELQTDIATDTDRLTLAPRLAPLSIAWGGGRGWELLLTDATGELRLHRNFGGQRPPVLMDPRPVHAGGKPPLLPDDRTSIIVADLDGDQKHELVFGRADGRVFQIRAASGRDEAHAPEPLLGLSEALWFGGHAVVSAADIDADGDIDLIAGDACGRLWLARDGGKDGAADHRFADPIPIDAGGEPFQLDPGPDGLLEGPIAPRLGYSCPTLADWTGNGRPDLIVGGAGGEVLFFRNNGAANDPRFDLPVALRCEGGPLITPPRVRPAVAEWTGAAQPDLIALDLQGFLSVFPRKGNLELGAPTPLVDRLGRLIRLDGSFAEAGGCALWAGPWTGPGKLDILVGLPRGARHVIPAITGQPLTTIDDLPTVLLLENAGRGVLIPRPIRLRNGRPLIVGTKGCSPCGADWSGNGALDLVVGADDGFVRYYRRSDLAFDGIS